MSASTINRKIAKGLAKVGKKLGYKFTLYRPDNYIDPLEDRNKLMTVQASWSKDEQFKANPEPTLDQYTIFTDFTKLIVGDILRSEELNRIFIINEINELRGAVSFQASDLFDVKRPVHTPTSDVKVTLVDVITGMPGAVQYAMAKRTDITGNNSATRAGQSIIELWTWLPVDQIRLNDIIVVTGKNFLVVSVDTSLVGMKIRAESTKAGT
jgi:hypothetical protein